MPAPEITSGTSIFSPASRRRRKVTVNSAPAAAPVPPSAMPPLSTRVSNTTVGSSSVTDTDTAAMDRAAVYLPPVSPVCTVWVMSMVRSSPRSSMSFWTPCTLTV